MFDWTMESADETLLSRVEKVSYSLLDDEPEDLYVWDDYTWLIDEEETSDVEETVECDLVESGMWSWFIVNIGLHAFK